MPFLVKYHTIIQTDKLHIFEWREQIQDIGDSKYYILMKYVIYIYLDFEVVVFKLRSTRGSICSLCAQQGEARELQILPQVLSNLNTTIEKSKYLYYYYLNF